MVKILWYFLCIECIELFLLPVLWTDDNIYVLATYELAPGASFDYTLSEEETCNDIYVDEDFYKEGLETFVLWLKANEFFIFFGRDQALFLVPSNDGNSVYTSLHACLYGLM